MKKTVGKNKSPFLVVNFYLRKGGGGVKLKQKNPYCSFPFNKITTDLLNVPSFTQP